MKILHIETGKNLYGGALQVYYLLEGLLQYSCLRHELVCAPDSEILTKCQRLVTCHPVTMRGDVDVFFLSKLMRLIKKTSPAIIHVHSRRGADIWGGLAAKFCGLKSILTRRVDNPEPKLFVRAKSNLFSKIITISQGIMQVMIQEGAPPEKLRCVPSAVDFDFYQRNCNLKWFRQEFGFDEESQVIGMIAQFIERKGHQFLIRSIPRIVKYSPKAKFIFFGQGPLQEDISKTIQELGLQEVVYFAGFRTDMEKILPCLDLVVHPASMEGLGVSLLQAAAAGVPIVATSVGGIPEIVHNGENGYLVSFGDDDGLSQAVITLLNNQELAGRFSRAGKDLMRNNFSIPAMVHGNLRVYKEVIGKDV